MQSKPDKAWADLIWQDKGRMSGAPCFYGTRIRIQDLFDRLASGGSVEDFLETYPHVTRDRVVRVLRLVESDLLKSIDVA